MRVVQIIAGAGGMYCGACLHGTALTRGLTALGVDVVQVPVYTPLRSDDPPQPRARVFFGGINVYLQQRWSLFRRLPHFLDRWLDHPALLRRAGQAAGSTRAEELGPMTVSMLQGEEGRQRKEIDRLAAWLQRELRPDVIHLGNALLVGMARELQRRLDVPVLATLAGEDLFVDQLPPPHHGQARELLRQRCGELAALVAMNEYYAQHMAEYLKLPRAKFDVVPPGLNLEGHASPDAPRSGLSAATAGGPTSASGIASQPATIGFLARLAPEKGLHLLADALMRLAGTPDLPPVRVKAAGWLSPVDRPYLDDIRKKLTRQGLADRFDYVGEVDRAAKIAFLQGLDVFCLPSLYQESKGLPVLEAWANGLPVVVPSHGTFPELVADTGGGLLCEPIDPASLAETLARLLRDPELGRTLGRRGQQAVHARYNATELARRTLAVYQRVARRGAGCQPA